MTGLRGVGAGWRPEIAAVLDATDGLGFYEVIAESVSPDALPGPLRRRGPTVVPHGVRLSLGGTDPVAPERVTHLAACAEAFGAPLVSEHVAFVRAGGREAGHLLPVPRTAEALDVLTENVARVRSELDVPLALEPIAALFDWPEDEFTEAEFLTRLLDSTDTLLLLDVANVHANALNRGRDPREVLDALPLDRVAYCHVAGGTRHDGLYHDTHTAAVPRPVLDLLAHAVDRFGDAVPPVMLERDGRYPPAAEMRAELAAIAHVAGHAPRTDRTPPAAPLLGVPHTPQHVRHAGAGCDSAGPTGAEPTGAEPTGAGPAGTQPTGAGPTVAEPAGSGSARPEPIGDHAGARRGDRAGLTARQAALVDALVAGGPDPAAVDAARLAATRAALLRKRAGLAAREWPRLAAELGPGWPDAFAERFAGVEPTDGLREGWDLARTLHEGGRLPAGAVAELAEREASLRYDGHGPPVRRRRWAAALRRRLRRP